MFHGKQGQSAQTPNEKGVAQASPPVTSQTPAKANSDQSKAHQFSLPVRIIQSQEDASSAKAREAKSDEHDAKDLDAQIRSADAAQEQVRLTQLSLVLAAIGTIGLIVSLAYNRKAIWAAAEANETARKAIAQEQINAQKQIRAYLQISEAAIQRIQVGTVPGQPTQPGIGIFTKIKNFGQSPAIEFQTWIESKILPKDEPAPTTTIPPDARMSKTFLGAGLDIKSHFGYAVSPEQFDSILRGDSLIWVAGIMKYKDVFGISHTVTFLSRATGPESNVFDNDKSAIGWSLDAHGSGNEMIEHEPD